MKKNLLALLTSLIVLTGCSSSVPSEVKDLLSNKAVNDLQSVFEQLNTSKFTYNNKFSELVNRDLEEVIVTDILMEKLENFPKTQTVISLTHQNNPKIKQKNVSEDFRVTITGTGDSYWLVGGEKSSIPGEIETTRIREDYPATYILDYRKTDSGYLLVNFEDDNGQYLGESRTWPGRKELMERYKKDPTLIE